MADNNFPPDVPVMEIIPRLLVEGDRRPVVELITNSAQDAFDAGVSAERLGLGWVVTGYHTAEIEDVDHREYRVLVYRQLRSEVGPMLPKEDP